MIFAKNHSRRWLMGWVVFLSAQSLQAAVGLMEVDSRTGETINVGVLQQNAQASSNATFSMCSLEEKAPQNSCLKSPVAWQISSDVIRNLAIRWFSLTDYIIALREFQRTATGLEGEKVGPLVPELDSRNERAEEGQAFSITGARDAAETLRKLQNAKKEDIAKYKTFFTDLRSTGTADPIQPLYNSKDHSILWASVFASIQPEATKDLCVMAPSGTDSTGSAPVCTLKKNGEYIAWTTADKNEDCVDRVFFQKAKWRNKLLEAASKNVEKWVSEQCRNYVWFDTRPVGFTAPTQVAKVPAPPKPGDTPTQPAASDTGNLLQASFRKPIVCTFLLGADDQRTEVYTQNRRYPATGAKEPYTAVEPLRQACSACVAAAKADKAEHLKRNIYDASYRCVLSESRCFGESGLPLTFTQATLDEALKTLPPSVRSMCSL